MLARYLRGSRRRRDKARSALTSAADRGSVLGGLRLHEARSASTVAAGRGSVS